MGVRALRRGIVFCFCFFYVAFIITDEQEERIKAWQLPDRGVCFCNCKPHLANPKVSQEDVARALRLRQADPDDE